jgi:hypothetical protein
MTCTHEWTFEPMRPAAMLISPSVPHGTSPWVSSVAFGNALTSVLSGTVNAPRVLELPIHALSGTVAAERPGYPSEG